MLPLTPVGCGVLVNEGPTGKAEGPVVGADLSPVDIDDVAPSASAAPPPGHLPAGPSSPGRPSPPVVAVRAPGVAGRPGRQVRLTLAPTGVDGRPDDARPAEGVLRGSSGPVEVVGVGGRFGHAADAPRLSAYEEAGAGPAEGRPDVKDGQAPRRPRAARHRRGEGPPRPDDPARRVHVRCDDGVDEAPRRAARLACRVLGRARRARPRPAPPPP